MQARYDLAVDAIKTFHTGVSEDFLLKQDQFKELRDRLLKSAADFYGKLGALLGRETDIASRRALAASNFELADLTGKVGRSEDALAAHRAVLAAREALAAEPGAGAAAKADVGRSLTAVAVLLESTGKTEEALAAYRRSESLLAGPAGVRPVGAGRAGGLPVAAGLAPLRDGQDRRGPGDLHAWPGPTRRRWPPPPGPRTTPGATWRTRSAASASCWRQTGKPAEAEAEYRAALAILQKLADDQPRRHRIPQPPGAQPQQPRQPAAGKRASRRRRRPSTARRWRSTRSWPTTTPPSPNSAAAWRISHLQPRHPAAQTGKPAEAEAEYRAALAIYRKLADDHPAVTEFRRGLADSHILLGNLLSQTGKAAEAEAEYRTALAIYRKLADDHPAVTEFRRGLAVGHLNLGVLLSQTGKAAEAEDEYRAALTIYRKLADDNPKVPGYRSEAAKTDNNLSAVLRRLGRPDEARDHVERAVAALEALVKAYPHATDYNDGLAENYLRPLRWPAAPWATPPGPRPTPDGRWSCGTPCRRGRASSIFSSRVPTPLWRAWPAGTARACRPPRRRARPRRRWLCCTRPSAGATAAPMLTASRMPSTRSAAEPISDS